MNSTSSINLNSGLSNSPLLNESIKLISSFINGVSAFSPHALLSGIEILISLLFDKTNTKFILVSERKINCI